MFRSIKETYGTYVNNASARERHWPRLFGYAAGAAIICMFSDLSSKNIYGMMITGLTILTGFTFTALFSDHALADVGLPKPKNETDIFELKKLETLAKNFQIRSNYFIILSIIDVCILIIISADFAIPNFISDFGIKMANYLNISTPQTFAVLKQAATGLYLFISFWSVLIFLECLYTFYRLSETIIAVVNTRREYMRS